jgi:uncharacterized membrane protein HdeD (DUF308 family)
VRPSAASLLAPARRFGGLLGTLVAIVAAISVLGGLALGSSLERSLATGFYIVGSFLLLFGVFAGIRGPVRPKEDPEGGDAVGGMFGVGVFSRGIRTATSDERRDSRSTTWLFFALGACLIVLGVLVDSRASLVP